MLTSSRTPTSVSSAHVAPGGGWWIIAAADVRMRSEHMEKLRRRADQAYVSNPESGFDPAQPWDWVFALAARGRDFWTAHVKDRADQFMHHLIIKNTSSVLMQSQPLERTEYVVWTTNQIVPTDPADQNGKVAPREDWGATETSKLYGNVAKVRGIYQCQVCFKWARDGGCTDGLCPDGRLHVCEHCGSSWHRSSCTQAAVRRVRQRARSWARRRRGSESLAQ